MDSIEGDVGSSKDAVGIKDQVAAEAASKAGWGEPQRYDYERYKHVPLNAKDKDSVQNIASNDASNLGSTETSKVTPVETPAGDASKDASNQASNTTQPAWAANAMKYEWSDEYGDVGPPHPGLEAQLFNDEHINRTGIAFDKIAGIEVTFESTRKVKPALKFEHAGLHPIMLENIKLCQYDVPTPIQAYCMPSVLQGQDVIAIAQTGSGKTAAYLIPIISKLMGKAKQLAAPRPDINQFAFPQKDYAAQPLVLVAAPTRELATQIFDEARRLCYRSMLRPCVLYGGAPTMDQLDELRRGCDILIATPGRLIDFMGRGGCLSLRRVKYTVIDEADEMVSVDWTEEMEQIMNGGDNNADADHVYMMFSATFPREARQVAKTYMSADHIRIRVGRAGSSHINITQRIQFEEEFNKRTALWNLMLSMPPSRTIVFVNNKKAADLLDDFMFNKGLPSTSIHSDRTQREREDAIRAFKTGKAPILVATGVSARGLDIKNVMHVVNYDLPSAEHGGLHEYVHRIGRTARIGNIGLATSFYNNKNEDIADGLVKLLIETKQEVPEFLSQYKPVDTTNLDFEDNSDDEADGHKDDEVWGAVPSVTATGANNHAAGHDNPVDPTDPWSVPNTDVKPNPPAMSAKEIKEYDDNSW